MDRKTYKLCYLKFSGFLERHKASGYLSKQDKEDLIQATFLGLVKGNYLDQSQSNLERIGYTILKRRIICHTRTRTRKPMHDPVDVGSEGLQEKRVCLADAIIKALDRVSVADRDYILRDVMGIKDTTLKAPRHKILNIRTKIMAALRDLKMPLKTLKI